MLLVEQRQELAALAEVEMAQPMHPEHLAQRTLVEAVVVSVTTAAQMLEEVEAQGL